MMTESTLITIVAQGGFGALFVWLLFDTRRESKAREERLIAVLEKQADNLPAIKQALDRIEVLMKKEDF